MKLSMTWIQQLGKALEFANHVGSPSALSRLLAEQDQPVDTTRPETKLVVANTTAKAEANNIEATQLPRLACVR